MYVVSLCLKEYSWLQFYLSCRELECQEHEGLEDGLILGPVPKLGGRRLLPQVQQGLREWLLALPEVNVEAH